MAKKFDTDAPHISEATLAQVRAAAHRFLLAGGSIFPNDRDTDLYEHLGNVESALDSTQPTETWADVLDGLDYDTHEKIWSAAMAAITTRSDAAFLFGAYVGLEIAALTPACAAERVSPKPARQGKTGSAR